MFLVEQLRVPIGRRLVSEAEVAADAKRVAEARARLDAFWEERGYEPSRKMT